MGRAHQPAMGRADFGLGGAWMQPEYLVGIVG